MAVKLEDISIKKNAEKADAKGESRLQQILNTEIGGGGINDAFRESFYSELALLLEAGLNIKSALDLLTSQQKKKNHKSLLQTAVDDLTQGSRFSDVLRDLKKFSAYEYFSIKIGEETGNLTEILRRLSSFYTQKIQQRRALISALTYPGIILLTAVLAVTFMLTYMVPLFDDIFNRMGGELPGLTKMIISISEGFGSLISWTLVIAGILFLIHMLNRKKEWYLKLRSSLLLGIPIVGKFMANSYILRLIQSMSLLISSRVPLTEALELSGRMVKFYPISSSVDKIRYKILQGMSLHESMSQFPIYDSRLIALIRVGEESNQLPLIFNKVAVQMEEELSHKAKILGNTLEPLIILFLGFFVALILIAMYLPMFQLSSSIGY